MTPEQIAARLTPAQQRAADVIAGMEIVADMLQAMQRHPGINTLSAEAALQTAEEATRKSMATHPLGLAVRAVLEREKSDG